MASPNNIKLSVTDAPVFSFNPKVETAEKASELLQKDEQEHNIYFNDMGFHSKFSDNFVHIQGKPLTKIHS